MLILSERYINSLVMVDFGKAFDAALLMVNSDKTINTIHVLVMINFNRAFDKHRYIIYQKIYAEV